MLLLNDNFVLRKIFDTFLLIPIKRNAISNDTLYLNTTAAAIISECNSANNAHDLAMSVSAKFVDIDKNDIIPELEAYVRELILNKILIEG